MVQSRRLWVHHIERRVGASDDAGTRIFLFWTCSKKVGPFFDPCLCYGILCHLIPMVLLGLQCMIHERFILIKVGLQHNSHEWIHRKSRQFCIDECSCGSISRQSSNPRAIICPVSKSICSRCHRYLVRVRRRKGTNLSDHYIHLCLVDTRLLSDGSSISTFILS